MSKNNGFLGRVWWLIKLRWIAVIGVLCVISFVNAFLGIPLPFYYLYSISFVFGMYNLVFVLWFNKLKNKPSTDISREINIFTNVQISLDLVTLAVLIHLSGGVENPFIFYFIFHMIIASILLRRKTAFLQATFAVFLFCLIVITEYLGALPHHHLTGFIAYDQYNNLIYVGGVSFVFISTIYISVYMATSIAEKLREQEKRLSEANRHLMEKDRIKNEYVLRVTHDIKEHLAAIQSCIEPVIGGICGGLNEKQKNLLQRASNRTGKLIFFVRALLEVTRIKLSKQIDFGSFSFKEMLAEAIEQITFRAKAKNISINTTIAPSIDSIRGNKEYIQECIINILANSVKYTPVNGNIDIDVMDRGTSILIQIKDTGIGIPKDELPKIFEEFYRASNARAAERDGTGLGLSIVKQIIERHNGKIFVESELGEGTNVSIILPR